ncbi:type IV pilin [Halorubrum halophilum]|uniref:type IV pilin n=1 Tax=Halorubrum halophilum TaxID=413816 RepID=UPI0009E624D8|nr:type IV pilin N-terminal domain-containing protein [Halorubrum halophilum]
MNPKSAFQDSERAVSPVIGVILMVAITVILAAVIGTFVLGLGDQLGGSATAGVTVDGDGTTNVTVTLTNTGTAESIKVVNNSGGTVTPSRGSDSLNSTGASASFDSTVTTDPNDPGDYNVVAVGPGGEQSVLRSFTLAAEAE